MKQTNISVCVCVCAVQSSRAQCTSQTWMEWNEKSFANNKLNISLWKRIATTQNAAVLKGYAFKEKSSECYALSLSIPVFLSLCMRCKSSREISILVSVLGYALMESMAWNINTTNNNNNPKVNLSDWNPLISIVLLLTIVFPTRHPFQHVCFDSRNIFTFYMVHFDTQNPLRFI